MEDTPKIIFVKNPDSIVDDTLKQGRNMKKEVEKFDFSFLHDKQKIKVLQNFRKYMDVEEYQKQSPDAYVISSELIRQKFERILDGSAEITVEVRDDEGKLQNDEAKNRKIKVQLFNQESTHFIGYHLAILFLEVDEEAWFVFDDAYTAPQYFFKDLSSLNYKLEMQSVNQFYKIKLHKLKYVLRKKDAIPQEECTPEMIQKTKEEELQNISYSLTEFQEKLTNITNEYYRKQEYQKAYNYYRKLLIDSRNKFNRYIKFIEENHPKMIELKQLIVKIGQNATVSAFQAERYQLSLEQSQDILTLEPTNQKSLYFQAKSYYKLSYFDKAELFLSQYIQKFQDDLQSKKDFEMYILICKKNQNKMNEKEKKLYPRIMENLQAEEQKEKIRKLNQQSIETDLKLEKEAVIQKCLNKDGYEFNSTEFELLSKLEGDQEYEGSDDGDNDHTHTNDCCDE